MYTKVYRLTFHTESLLYLCTAQKHLTMKLIEELSKQDSNNSSEYYRWLKAIKAGNYKLSVQGSSGHYCKPRQTVSVDTYSEMELAIINKKGDMVSANRSSLLRKFNRYAELVDRADGLNSSATVYGYVPVDLLNDLYMFLTEG
jgi:hypothetical protein